jgi:hypothetical protein
LKVLYRIFLERLKKITKNSSNFSRRFKSATSYMHVYSCRYVSPFKSKLRREIELVV